jgi:hypothetical protein
VSTAPKMKPAKAAGKLNSLPAVVGTPSEAAQKQTEANDNGLATVIHASGKPRERWRMSARPVQTLDSVVDSVGRLFFEEASTVFFDSTREVAEQVRSVPNADKRKHLETCRELFKMGWLSWLEALGELLHGYGEKFTQIAMSRPALVTDDPVKWIRVQLRALLSRHLRQELNMEALAEQATQRSLARREARRNGIASNPAPLESQPGHPRNYSKVGAWFRWVAEGGPDFDRSESGFHEPWTAPAFVDDHGVFVRLREKMTSDPIDRLTAAQTERVIRHVEALFAGRFNHMLQQVEDKARITLSTNGAVPFALAGGVQNIISTPSALRASADQQRSTSDKFLGGAKPLQDAQASKRDHRQEVWPGTARQLGDEVFEQFRNGTIAAKTERDALKKACAVFVKEDGTPFKATSIFQSLKNRKDIERKEPALRPKALSTLVKRFANVISRKPSL